MSCTKVAGQHPLNWHDMKAMAETADDGVNRMGPFGYNMVT